MDTKKINQIISDAIQSGSWLSFRNAARQITRMQQGDGLAPKHTLKVAFVSSFTIDPLVDFAIVRAAESAIRLRTYIAPYGQPSQEILNPQSGLYAFSPDVTVLIIEPNTLADTPQDATQQILTLSNTYKQNASGTLIVTNFIASPDWPLHVLPSEQQSQIQKANQSFAEHLADDMTTQLCDLDSLAAYHGYANTFSPEMTAMARIPFSEGFLDLLAQKLLSHLKIQAGLIRKCLVLDCDNTLWGGIIGEDGMDGIQLGPDWPGREFVNFQKAILELFNQGVILAINSKNNEADVMQVLRDHPHMVLRENHFAAICANWNPKPDNIKAIAQQINIGIDTLVFVDDNPVERDLMKQTVPEVAVLDLPDNPALFEQTLRQTSYFTKAALTEEDKQRGRIYADQRKRVELEKSSMSLDDYLQSLEMICTIRQAQTGDIKRAAQLTQRTNQFNLTTRRYSEVDIEAMLNDPGWAIYVLALKDKFGDNGTVGLALIKTKAWNGSDTICDDDLTDIAGKTWRIDTFLMSCRVIGRQAEDALVDRICIDAAQSGASQLTAEFIKTPKNNLVADFWPKMNFIETEANDEKVCYDFNLAGYTPKTFEYLKFE